MKRLCDKEMWFYRVDQQARLREHSRHGWLFAGGKAGPLSGVTTRNSRHAGDSSLRSTVPSI